ncbi:DUF6058 family natural product biosynthesis protein [Maritalea sp.]|jgi:hypothetical protein|uniref:DUF6058 family natural product biosynthesis protein n=1 Tax=Maritalea sp. TaxID=2003361 RepID=UPI0039E3AB9E
MLNYLFEHFHERAQLISLLNGDAAFLETMLKTRCAPQPAYRLNSTNECNSYFGTHVESAELQFFASGQIGWLSDLRSKAIETEQKAKQLFESRYCAAHAQFCRSELAQHIHALSEQATSAPTNQKMQSTWQHFLDGTYGVCTSDGLPETIFLKQTLVASIDTFIANNPSPTIKNPQRHCLTKVVNALDKVEALFAPHEHQRSSRQRCIVNVRTTYLNQ